MIEIDMQFTGEIFEYLKDLEQNNNREWFAANKDRLQPVRSQFESFFDDLIQKIYKFDESIGRQTAAKCMYRMHRDTRFSKDKTPFKIHIAAFVASGGYKQHHMPGYYLHIQNNESCAGAGLHMPLPKDLDKIRKEIYYNIDEFKAIIESPDYCRFYNGFFGPDKLKKAPKNFPSDFPDIELLKNKSYSIITEFSNEEVLSKDFFDRVLSAFKVAHPFNRFLNRGLIE